MSGLASRECCRVGPRTDNRGRRVLRLGGHGRLPTFTGSIAGTGGHVESR